MSSNTLSPLKRAALTVTILFAMVGVYATYAWTQDYARRPHHFAKPFSFVILDIENPKDPQAAKEKISVGLGILEGRTAAILTAGTESRGF